MQRLVEVETVSFEEESNEQSLRPSNWDDYIGQEKIKKNLRVFIDASRKRASGLGGGSGWPLDAVDMRSKISFSP